MLRAGYANRGRDEWTVHAEGSKDSQQINETQEKNTHVKFGQLRRFTFLKQTGNKERGFPKSNIG